MPTVNDDPSKSPARRFASFAFVASRQTRARTLKRTLALPKHQKGVDPVFTGEPRRGAKWFAAVVHTGGTRKRHAPRRIAAAAAAAGRDERDYRPLLVLVPLAAEKGSPTARGVFANYAQALSLVPVKARRCSGAEKKYNRVLNLKQYRHGEKNKEGTKILQCAGQFVSKASGYAKSYARKLLFLRAPFIFAPPAANVAVARLRSTDVLPFFLGRLRFFCSPRARKNDNA